MTSILHTSFRRQTTKPDYILGSTNLPAQARVSLFLAEISSRLSPVLLGGPRTPGERANFQARSQVLGFIVNGNLRGPGSSVVSAPGSLAPQSHYHVPTLHSVTRTAARHYTWSVPATRVTCDT